MISLISLNQLIPIHFHSSTSMISEELFLKQDHYLVLMKPSRFIRRINSWITDQITLRSKNKFNEVLTMLRNLNLVRFIPFYLKDRSEQVKQLLLRHLLLEVTSLMWRFLHLVISLDSLSMLRLIAWLIHSEWRIGLSRHVLCLMNWRESLNILMKVLVSRMLFCKLCLF